MLLARVKVAAIVIVIVTRQFKHTIGNKVLAGAIALDNSLDEVLGHIGVVG